MSKTEVLTAAARRNMFLSPEALDMIMSNTDPVGFTNTVLSLVSKANSPNRGMAIPRKDCSYPMI